VLGEGMLLMDLQWAEVNYSVMAGRLRRAKGDEVFRARTDAVIATKALRTARKAYLEEPWTPQRAKGLLNLMCRGPRFKI